MSRYKLSLAIAPLLLILAFPGVSLAKDVIRITDDGSERDVRNTYHNTLIEEALLKTIDTYGEFTIEATISKPQRKRALVEIINGTNLNVHVAVTQPEWETKTIPIRIPILKGILGYRLFLIKRQNLAFFSTIDTSEKLKKTASWSWAVLEHHQGHGATGFQHRKGRRIRRTFQHVDARPF